MAKKKMKKMMMKKKMMKSDGPMDHVKKAKKAIMMKAEADKVY